MTAGPGIPAVVNFFLLAGGLVYLLRKPIAAAVGGRHEKIKKEVEESEALRLTVEKMVREYEGKLAGLDAEIARVAAEAKAEGEKERTRILKRAEEAAAKIMEDARLAAEKESQYLKRKLESEIVAKAVAQAVKSLREKVSAGDHKMFTDELIRSIEAGHGQR